MKTHTEKALELLTKAGTEGIHSFTLNYQIGSTRSAARINDLKKQGHKITSVFEKIGGSMGVRYFLMSEPPKKETPKAFTWEFEGDIARRVYL